MTADQPPGTGPQPPSGNPYRQPGYQQSNPYRGWPRPQPVPQPPAGSGGRWRMALAVIAATALVAAAAVGGVLLISGSDGNTSAADDNTEKPAEKTAGETAGETGDVTESSLRPDDPRAGVQNRPDPVVAGEWQVQTYATRDLAFDVPPDWTTSSDDYKVWITSEDDPDDILVGMSAVALYMENWCNDEGLAARAMAGTRGSIGSTDTADAAATEAEAWARAHYDQAGQATLEVSEARPFSSAYGIEGHTATATVTGVPEEPDSACGAWDGKVVTVSYLDSGADIATWILVADTGFEEELDDVTIEKIMNSLRPYDG
ncbi:hypothetical protein [Streptomyces aidingensis]|uniref:DUF8017 domain-containing protein n=1 Tax=Streptomyces aidingensis TaxID=910347 RepID=A0A1I1FA55_9ACTN|nr:hypothetical protein [Streptomyces aidingensis]SFB94033.1 hypothetical protein SAMN05421773_101608 [Streptomyces aidingensis]